LHVDIAIERGVEKCRDVVKVINLPAMQSSSKPRITKRALYRMLLSGFRLDLNTHFELIGF
jgi:hypothetical protein